MGKLADEHAYLQPRGRALLGRGRRKSVRERPRESSYAMRRLTSMHWLLVMSCMLHLLLEHARCFSWSDSITYGN